MQQVNIDFTKKTYRFDDIPKKKQYLVKRFLKIYGEENRKQIELILDQIRIVFRKQDEKGASNHLNKMIYVSFNEIKKYDIKTEKDFLKYLVDPKSIITHETIHIFQNLSKAFPDRNYLYKDQTGKRKIDYEKYVTDAGEIESRVEQVIELLSWGFGKEEIVEFLYNRRENDKDLWRLLVDNARELKKESSSKMPGIDEDEDVTNEQGRQKGKYQQKDIGKNYEKNYLT